MNIRNTQQRWGAVSMALHWLIALTVLAMIPLGIVAERMAFSPLKIDLFWVHKSLGMLILGAMVLRLLWRLAKPLSGDVPALPSNLKRWERMAAHGTHYGLYVLLIAMPLSGWVINSAANFPLSVFGWFTVPPIVGPDESVQDVAAVVHRTLSWAITGVIVLHIAAALKHHFVLKDNVLRRMLPFVRTVKEDRS